MHSKTKDTRVKAASFIRLERRACLNMDTLYLILSALSAQKFISVEHYLFKKMSFFCKALSENFGWCAFSGIHTAIMQLSCDTELQRQLSPQMTTRTFFLERKLTSQGGFPPFFFSILMQNPMQTCQMWGNHNGASKGSLTLCVAGNLQRATSIWYMQRHFSPSLQKLCEKHESFIMRMILSEKIKKRLVLQLGDQH